MTQLNKNQKLILNGNITKAILILAGPIMMNNVVQSTYNITDTYFVSQLGSIPMAAMTLVWPVVFFFLAIGMGMNIAGTSLIAQYIGNGKKEDAKRTAGELISISIILSLGLGLPAALGSYKIVSLMGAEGEVLTNGVAFLRIMLLGMPSLFLFLAYAAILQGQGDTMTPMKLKLSSLVLNIILDPLLIFVFNFGIAGAAIATVFSRGIFAAYGLKTLFSEQDDKLVLTYKDLIPGERIIDLFKVGLPNCIGQSMAAFGFMFLNMFIIDYGNETIAAFGIGNRISSFVLMPAMGIGTALATIVGQNLGADKILRARSAIKRSAFLSTVIMGGAGLMFYQFIPNLTGFFTEDITVFNQTVDYLQLIILTLPLMGFFQVFIGTYQGSGHTIYSMIMMVGRLWALRIPLILFFKEFTSFGPTGVWYSMILSNFIISLVGLAIYHTRVWETKVISETKKEIKSKNAYQN
ncbi:MAG: MATE family efflux transporter [Bacillota bacterium]